MSESTYRAAKYIRLSYADDTHGESDSIGNQRKIIDNFIKNNADIEAVSEYVDDGYSGIVFDRPQFQEMIDDIKSGNINCVIVKDLSRFGRENTETGRYLRRILPAYGVRFIAINDNVDTAKDMSCDDLSVLVKNITNDAYSRDISVKTRSALSAKRQNGDYIGACPIYGYRKSGENKNRLVIDEYAAGIVHDIFKMKINGASAAKIAENLNNLGILSPIEYKKNNGLPHPTGGYADKSSEAKWSATTVIRILQDETYTGSLIQGKQYTLNYKIKELVDRPQSEWVKTENAHEAIIQSNDFDLVQRIMRLDTRTAPNGEKVQIFSGILICGSCGNRMTRKTVPYKNEKYFYYCCTTGRKNGCASSVMVKESDLLECVLNSIRSHIANVASLETVLSNTNVEKTNQALIKKYTAQIAESEKLLEQNNGFKSTLYENFVKGFISKDEYKIYKNKYAETCRKLEAANERVQQELSDILNNTSEKMKWTEHFKKFEGLQELDRKTVINLIQSIKIVDKTTIQITFNYQAEYEKSVEMTHREAG